MEESVCISDRCEGFLPSIPFQSEFKFDLLQPHELVYEALPQLVKYGTVRDCIGDLPFVNVSFQYESMFDSNCVLLETLEEQEAVFSLFGFLASSYVHVQSALEKTKPVLLPECVAMPLKRLAGHLDRYPILDYGGCVLYNWVLEDPHEELTLENIRILRTFTRISSEEWFYKIHIAIEYYGGEAIVSMQDIFQIVPPSSFSMDAEVVHFEVVRRVHNLMESVVDSLKHMNSVLDRMREGCKSHDFYNIVRPWLSGWNAAGVIYGDSGELPEVYSGGSGAQSSLLPCFDAFLGLQHATHTPEDDKFLKSLRSYRNAMPKKHRALIEKLESGNSIRVYIEYLERSHAKLKIDSRDNNVPLYMNEENERSSISLGQHMKQIKLAYNACVEQVLSFRRKHIGLAISYISSQARLTAQSVKDEGTRAEMMEQAKVGTGGSHFSSHLSRHIDDTRRCLYEVDDVSKIDRSGGLAQFSIFSRYHS